MGHVLEPKLKISVWFQKKVLAVLRGSRRERISHYAVVPMVYKFTHKIADNLRKTIPKVALLRSEIYGLSISKMLLILFSFL